MKLRKRMILLIALPTLAIYIVVLGLAMAYLQDAARNEVEQQTSRLASNYAARFDGAFREAATIAMLTARFTTFRVPSARANY